MGQRVRESASRRHGKESEVFITHSYAGTMIGAHRYLFFALYEDYNDAGRASSGNSMSTLSAWREPSGTNRRLCVRS